MAGTNIVPFVISIAVEAVAKAILKNVANVCTLETIACLVEGVPNTGELAFLLAVVHERGGEWAICVGKITPMVGHLG